MLTSRAANSKITLARKSSETHQWNLFFPFLFYIGFQMRISKPVTNFGDKELGNNECASVCYFLFLAGFFSSSILLRKMKFCVRTTEIRSYYWKRKGDFWACPFFLCGASSGACVCPLTLLRDRDLHSKVSLWLLLKAFWSSAFSTFDLGSSKIWFATNLTWLLECSSSLALAFC